MRRIEGWWQGWGEGRGSTSLCISLYTKDITVLRTHPNVGNTLLKGT